MLIGKIFQNGRSQAVRLPKECRFDCDEVMIRKIGNNVLLMPKPKNWDDFFNALEAVSDDFMQDEIDLPSQDRESLDD